jgi:glycolate oxidase iron-sulfur subunit
MLHEIPPNQHGPLSLPMARAIESCVHCGFCLAACPTYQELGQEMDSPRGRIVLMKEVLEGKLPWQDAQTHIDRCLGCLACEPACPSGVPYRDLISPFRGIAAQQTRRSLPQRLTRWITAQTIPYPGRFRKAVLLGRLGKSFSWLVPKPLKPMLDLLPDQLPPRQSWPAISPARGECRARVALLTGCAQQVLAPDINTATIEVLTRNGVEVHIPANQGCCGGLAWHSGNPKQGQQFARRNLQAFPEDLDAILTNAAGCGSAMHEYHLLLRGTSDEAKADRFRQRVWDVSAFLHRLGLSQKLPDKNQTLRIAYHDACHLANAQGVSREPRELLKAIPGVELIELPNSHLCCGSAGSYNIDQPQIANSLGEQKARSVMDSGASLVASGNIGCLTQLSFHLARLGSAIIVRHTLQILRDAYPSD